MKKIVRICSIIVMIGMIILIGKDYYERRMTEKNYKDLAEKVTNHESNSMIAQEKISKESEIPDWYQKYGEIVDFDALIKMNSDIVGWISFDHIDIHYPILAGPDNETYLRKNYEKKNAVAGSIFLDSINGRELYDYHTILYGHNMRNGSMFGQLKKYKQQEFYQDNAFFTIYTTERIMRYEIFSCHDTDAYGNIYTVGFGPNDEYQAFVTMLKDVSWYDTGVSVQKEDHVITLSTCTTNENNRFVIHAKMIDLIELTE